MLFYAIRSPSLFVCLLSVFPNPNYTQKSAWTNLEINEFVIFLCSIFQERIFYIGLSECIFIKYLYNFNVLGGRSRIKLRFPAQISKRKRKERKTRGFLLPIYFFSIFIRAKSQMSHYCKYLSNGNIMRKIHDWNSIKIHWKQRFYAERDVLEGKWIEGNRSVVGGVGVWRVLRHCCPEFWGMEASVRLETARKPFCP